MKTLLSSSLIVFLLVPSVALAADPNEAYDVYTETNARDTEQDLKERCIQILGYQDRSLRVGSELFNLRRCVTRLKKEDSNAARVSSMQDRLNRRFERSKVKAETLRRRTALFHRKTIRSQNLRRKIQSESRTWASTRARILKLRGKNRSRVHAIEDEITVRRRNRASRMREARVACNKTQGGYKREQCIYDFLQGENVLDQ